MSKLGIIRGRVWKFGNNISTTDITPSEMFDGIQTAQAKIVFAAIRPEWRKQVKAGDCIVAGSNFGFGSHRASANDVMKDLRIGCIVGDSIARVYFRNAIAIGFPIYSFPGVSDIFEEGDMMELDVYKGIVKNLSNQKSLKGNLYPSSLLSILEAGGIMPLILEKEGSPGRHS